jgi:hypothetical protein
VVLNSFGRGDWRLLTLQTVSVSPLPSPISSQ